MLRLKKHLLRTTNCALSLLLFLSASAQATPVPGQGTWETTLEGRDLDGNAATFEAYYDTTLEITLSSGCGCIE